MCKDEEKKKDEDTKKRVRCEELSWWVGWREDENG